MQRRSRAYQAALYFVQEADTVRGVPYADLVSKVAPFVDEERAGLYRISQLKKAPSETLAQTITKGQEAIARKYIDSARRAGIIEYHDLTLEDPLDWNNDTHERTVHWGRPARTGGTYSTPDGRREAEEYLAFDRYLHGENT